MAAHDSSADRARAWVEQVHIPTYAVAPPEKNPMFLEKRVYQGSSGAVYPLPVVERVFDQPEARPYTALFLENRYLKIMVLPELGGRVQMALDKTNGFHFVYYNQVIKPALVGLAGPWISGGIEFNWPQHHRPSTFMPLDWQVVEHADGSATISCAETERLGFTRAVHAFSLAPDHACLAIEVQLINRTELPQSFLWWANPAVHVNDDYQSVFPPDVRAVMDHGKRDVSAFPIATGTYYKVDYAPGTDISRYKNIPVPTSYMAHRSDFDFIGSYDHGRRAGMLHVANHHLVPGKKQWTWGTGAFGQAWDRQLTDEDGPYIELMCGAFTDNQPDFAWMMPGEEKRFAQHFLPYKLIGPPKNASTEVALNLELAGPTATLGVYSARPRTLVATLLHAGAPLWRTEVALSPATALVERVPLPPAASPQQLTLRVADAATGAELLSFTPLPNSDEPLPAPAAPAPPPAEVPTNEELFLHALHLEQYRHATFAPEDYYAEALRRDPGDARANNAFGLLLLRRGRFAEAEPYFRRAIARLTMRNPNPYDGEPLYNLGLALRLQGRFAEAVAPFYKATWSAAWQDAAFFELARLAARRGDLPEALALAERCLQRNAAHQQARHLSVALLRHAGRPAEALAAAEAALAADPLAAGPLWERRLLAGDERFAHLLRQDDHQFQDLGLSYFHAGLFTDAAAVFAAAPAADPLSRYYEALCYAQLGDGPRAAATFRAAADLSPDYCFPNRLETVMALEAAQAANPADARAPYYLGLFWYAHRRPDEAVACWERAATLDPAFPTVHRNLGLAAFNKRADPQRAWECYTTAFALDQGDARVLFELDQLARRLNHAPAERLARLAAHPELVAQRDDLTIEYVTLLNLLGRPAEALAALLARPLHPWEGGEGKAIGQYRFSLIAQARTLLAAGAPAEAAALLERAQVYPASLGEGKLPGAQENDIFYLLGLARAALGDDARARDCYERAATGLSEPTSAMYYNDQPPETIFYQGLARRRLGRAAEAEAIFRKLEAYGREHADDAVAIDYFAVSLPTFLVFDEDLGRRNRAHCHLMRALGLLGLGDSAAARAQLEAVLALDAAHQGAAAHLALLEQPVV